MNVRTSVKIGYGSGNFQNTGISTGREAEAVGNQLQHAIAGGVKFTVFLDEAWGHLGVTVDFGAFVALQLDFSGMLHALGNGCGTFGFAPIGEVAVFDSGDFDMDVNAVEKRPGDA